MHWNWEASKWTAAIIPFWAVGIWQYNRGFELHMRCSMDQSNLDGFRGWSEFGQVSDRAYRGQRHMTSRDMESTLVWIDASSWKYNTWTGSMLVGCQWYEIMELKQHNAMCQYKNSGCNSTCTFFRHLTKAFFTSEKDTSLKISTKSHWIEVVYWSSLLFHMYVQITKNICHPTLKGSNMFFCYVALIHNFTEALPDTTVTIYECCMESNPGLQSENPPSY